MNALIKNRRGGALTEYILLLTLFLGILLVMFWSSLRASLETNLDILSENLQIGSGKKTAKAKDKKEDAATGYTEATPSSGFFNNPFNDRPTNGYSSGPGSDIKIRESTAPFTSP